MVNKMRGAHLLVVMALILVFVLALSMVAFAETDVDPKDVFLKMPTTEDLTKEYDGKQPAWVDFDYDISPKATLWENDQSKGGDGMGLVWLNIYRWDDATNTYAEHHMGRYPGNMEGPGFNEGPGFPLEEAGFFNYGINYNPNYFSEKTIFPGKYKAIWRIPIYGTNTENYNEYDYVDYEVEFEITLPGIFTAVPELSRDINGNPVEAPEPAYDLAKIDYKGKVEDVETKEYWYKFDKEKEHYAGDALTAAPSEAGQYVYRLQVTDGKNLDENLYAEFELTDPNKVEPFYVARYSDIFVVPPKNPSKVYDGKPVTFADMGIELDLSRVGKQDFTTDDMWFEYVWYYPNPYSGDYNYSLQEFQGKETGPTEPGDYRFQWGVHANDDSFEGHIYINFTISEAPAAGSQKATDFMDVNATDWFHDAVQYALDNALFQGVSETSFAPQSTMTRAMMATVLYRQAGEPAVTAPQTALTDVVADSWYTDAVHWAVANGILLAENGVFGTNDPVVREQIGYALYAYAKLEGADVTAQADLSSFSDADQVGVWAEQAMAWAVEAKLFEGKGQNNLDPLGQATRAEVATLLMRFIESILK